MTNATHDPSRRSWVESANVPGCDFPIQNLPLGVFRYAGESRAAVGVAIGDSILEVSRWLPEPSLNAYCAKPADERQELRREWSEILAAGAKPCSLLKQSDCTMLLPAVIGDYTDFYASIHHASNVGKMFRPDNPLLPNYKHVPIGYHGRSSSLIVSGTPVRRPCGQLGEGKFGPSRELDYELELGAFLGPGNSIGQPIPIAEARQHLVGVCLVNDWSARDIQRWEYQPLGPFLAKNFATSISPWMVTAEALEPFRVDAAPHDVPILQYLQEPAGGAFAISLEVHLRTTAMSEPVRISQSNFQQMYWTLGQMIAHHASNGCPLKPGDLIASGTVSGPDKGNRGCLLELSWKGTEPITLPNGESRTFLQDGDEVILTGYCEKPGAVRIGLGTCRGIITTAPEATGVSPGASDASSDRISSGKSASPAS